jgi:hypothetical protein
MTLSQTYRTAFIAIAAFLLTAVFHTGAAAQTNSPQGLETLSLFTVRGPTDQAGPK